MPDRVLVTGGTGKTGGLVAELLADRGIERRIATRRLSSADQIRFDCDDATTHAPALDGVTSIYLVAPTDRMDHLPVIRPFLEQAVARLPGRVVLLSASSLDEGGPMMSAVHAWLHVHAPRWTVLRPSWFMQNFTTQHLPSIINEGSAIVHLQAAISRRRAVVLGPFGSFSKLSSASAASNGARQTSASPLQILVDTPRKLVDSSTRQRPISRNGHRARSSPS